MGNQNEKSGDTISQLIVSTAVLHAVMREFIKDPAISEEVLRRASESVERTCDHFAQQPDKASEAALWKQIYPAEINAAITHRR